VVPWANFMEDSLNEKLFKPLGLHFEFRPEMSDKGQEEERQRAGAYRAYVASGMKPSIAAQVDGIDLPPDIEYEDLDDVFVQPKPQPVNETEIPIEKEELPEPVDEKSVTLLTIDQLRELEHWQDLAFRKLKQGKSLMFPWVSKTLPEEVASVIRDRLPSCKTLAEIERAFDLSMPGTPDRQLRELADALNKAVEVVATEGKYSPNQPRVPSGHSEGGQWTDGIFPSVKKAIESIADINSERIYVFDPDTGNARFTRAGATDNVGVTSSELRKVKDGILLHNHPGGEEYLVFSKKDIKSFVAYDVREGWLVVGDYVMVVKRPADGLWPDNYPAKVNKSMTVQLKR